MSRTTTHGRLDAALSFQRLVRSRAKPSSASMTGASVAPAAAGGAMGLGQVCRRTRRCSHWQKVARRAGCGTGVRVAHTCMQGVQGITRTARSEHSVEMVRA